MSLEILAAFIVGVLVGGGCVLAWLFVPRTLRERARQRALQRDEERRFREFNLEVAKAQRACAADPKIQALLLRGPTNLARLKAAKANEEYVVHRGRQLYDVRKKPVRRQCDRFHPPTEFSMHDPVRACEYCGWEQDVHHF
jgi:hypothetical protein